MIRARRWVAAAAANSVRPVLADAREFSPTATVDIPAFELDEATITDLQDAMKSGKYTARTIAEKYLARIDQIDKQGPAINSIIELNPDALAIADVERNPEHYEGYGDAARKTYEQRFDPDRGVADLLDIYRYAITHPVTG